MGVHVVIVSVVGDDMADIMSVLQSTTELFEKSPQSVDIETLDTGQLTATAAYTDDSHEVQEDQEDQ